METDTLTGTWTEWLLTLENYLDHRRRARQESDRLRKAARDAQWREYNEKAAARHWARA